MGLFDHRHLRNESPFSRIIASLFLIILFFIPLFYYIKGIVEGSLGIGLAILFGFLLLFFCPFTLLSGIGEIVGSINEIKNKKK